MVPAPVRAPASGPVRDLNKARVLIVSDGRAGGNSQSLGVAEMLGFKNPEMVTLRPRLPQGWMSRWLRWLPVGMVYDDMPAVLRMAGEHDLLIGGGHGTTRVMRACKAMFPQLFLVAVMRPAGGPKGFDAVAIPQHDRPPTAENVIATVGNCNRVTREGLQTEAERWRSRLQRIRGFKLAVMIGGTSRHGQFDPREAGRMIDALARALRPLAAQGAGLLVSTSRRSGPSIVAAVDAALQHAEKTYGVASFFWDPGNPTTRDNPYMAYLALADAVVVTADSSSMLSEAVTAAKPLYVWGDEARMSKKFRVFFNLLHKQGRARWWDGQLTLKAPAAGLLDTLLVAGFVRARWQKRFNPKG